MTAQGMGNAFVLTWIAMAVIYDCWVYFVLRLPVATISDTLRSWVQWSPLVLIPLGGLLWHLFGVHRGLGPSPWYGWAPSWCCSRECCCMRCAVSAAFLISGRRLSDRVSPLFWDRMSLDAQNRHPLSRYRLGTAHPTAGHLGNIG